jgi:hypothetical protein
MHVQCKLLKRNVTGKDDGTKAATTETFRSFMALYFLRNTTHNQKYMCVRTGSVCCSSDTGRWNVYGCQAHAAGRRTQADVHADKRGRAYASYRMYGSILLQWKTRGTCLASPHHVRDEWRHKHRNAAESVHAGE